ncbi:MAG TPA: hypothetical protein PLM89_03315, partial [Anaerolineales bacterium]|nr:hypothetical protein [Anaerolineales bacterium]
MSATPIIGKKLAVARVGPAVEGNMMVVIISLKSDVKLVEEETAGFLRVPLGFLEFTDHSVIH